MPELRLDEVQAAFAETPDQMDSNMTIQSEYIPVDQLQLYDRQPEIDFKSYDLWYESALKSMTDAENPVLDFAGEAAAGGLSYLPDMTNKLVLGATSALGEALEAVSSKEKFMQEAKQIPIVHESIDAMQAFGNLADSIFGPGTVCEREGK